MSLTLRSRRHIGRCLWACEAPICGIGFPRSRRFSPSGDPPPKIFNILASQWREKTHEMAEYDFAVKSGKLEYDDALLALVL